MDIRRLVQGAASAERMRNLMHYRGTTMSGRPLWTEAELQTLRDMYPGYEAISKKLKRSYWAVRYKARALGLTPHRHVWTGADVSKLRKLYKSGTTEELAAAFPEFTLPHIRKIACYHGLRRPRKPFKITGHQAIDQIRERSFELGYSMPDLDALSRSKKYFARAGWHGGHIHHRAIGRAIEALDGLIKADWNE